MKPKRLEYGNFALRQSLGSSASNEAFKKPNVSRATSLGVIFMTEQERNPMTERTSPLASVESLRIDAELSNSLEDRKNSFNRPMRR